jgi:hypothetical protein
MQSSNMLLLREVDYALVRNYSVQFIESFVLYELELKTQWGGIEHLLRALYHISDVSFA